VALSQLRIARKLVAQGDEAVVTLEAPRIILKGAQVKTVKGIRPILVGENRVLELGGAVLLAKEKAKRMFRVTWTPAVPATNSYSAIDVESFLPSG
jgi:hypothetical protein